MTGNFFASIIINLARVKEALTQIKRRQYINIYICIKVCIKVLKYYEDISITFREIYFNSLFIIKT